MGDTLSCGDDRTSSGWAASGLGEGEVFHPLLIFSSRLDTRQAISTTQSSSGLNGVQQVHARCRVA
jgi:hypothetical protein